jgi:LysM repeat protein
MRRTRTVIPILLALLLVLTSTAWAAPAKKAPEAKKDVCGSCTYRVKKGDTLYSIGRRFGTSVRTLQRCNGIRNANRIYAGQRLVVPCKKAAKKPPKPPKHPPAKPPSGPVKNCRLLVVVKPGDTLTRIARHTCSTVDAIATRNHIWNPNRIYSGQRLCVPTRPFWCR